MTSFSRKLRFLSFLSLCILLSCACGVRGGVSVGPKRRKCEPLPHSQVLRKAGEKGLQILSVPRTDRLVGARD